MLDHYRSIYRSKQSKTVHAADGAYFLDSTAGLKLDIVPSPDNIQPVLFLAATLLIGAVVTLDGRLGLGFDKEVKERLRDLRNRGKDE